MAGEAKRKAHTALDEMAVDGAFKRTEAGFRNWVEKGSKDFPPEADRYHLYISLACPWANRCLAVLKMKGLEHAIGVSIVHPTWQRTRPDDPNDAHTGWVFRTLEDEPLPSSTGHGAIQPSAFLVPDTVNNCKRVRELYELANDTLGKYSVPVLWDKKQKTIVNNESSEIIRMFNSAFNDVATNPTLDLYPESHRHVIDEANEWIYPKINNGVYRCGFATTQAAYDVAVTELFEALDKLESLLSTSRYVAGDRFTEADIRLFMTLFRFDDIYVVYFKTCVRNLREYPNTFDYMRELYQILESYPKPVMSLEHCRLHYFTSHPKLNYYAIVPRDCGTEARLREPHSRANLPGLPIPRP